MTRSVAVVVVAVAVAGIGSAHAQTILGPDGRIIPYVPKLMPPEVDGPSRSTPKATVRGNGPASERKASTCSDFLRTDPNILRTVNGYANGSARNPNMTAEETVKFIAATIRDEVRRVASSTVNRDPALFYRSFEHIDRATIANCWPTLDAVIVGKERQEAVAAENERRQKEARQQKEREDEAAYAERAGRQAAIDAQPANRLERAYHSYIGVKQCVEARRGYAAIYLSEEQGEDAKAKVVAIEKALRASDPALDPDTIWTKANQPPTQTPTNSLSAVLALSDGIGRQWLTYPQWFEESDDYCKHSYAALTEQFTSLVPDARIVKKDF